MSANSKIQLSETLSKRVERLALDSKYYLLGFASRVLLDKATRRAFDDLAIFCSFVGHGRSGGTLVGALLNAHPNVVMSNELNALRRLRLGMSGEQVLRLIYLVSQRQVLRGSKGGGGYSYAIPHQWQGKHRQLSVIGDRKAGATAYEIVQHPESLDILERKVGLAKKFIHVVRNPFDTITTTFHKTSKSRGVTADGHLDREIRNYFIRCLAVKSIEERFGTAGIYFLYHERLIAEPYEQLQLLCQYLEIHAYSDYLNDCAAIISASPHESRKSLDWSSQHTAKVRHEIKNYHWLARYETNP